MHSLKELNDAKRDELMKKQLAGNEYFENWILFSFVRESHDKNYAMHANPEERAKLEAFLPETYRDKFRINETKRDGDLRHKFMTSGRVIKRVIGRHKSVALKVTRIPYDFLKCTFLFVHPPTFTLFYLV